jgi:hypothetical protein
MENVYYTLCTSLYVIITSTYNPEGGGLSAMPMLNRGGGKIWAKEKKVSRQRTTLESGLTTNVNM